MSYTLLEHLDIMRFDWLDHKRISGYCRQVSSANQMRTLFLDRKIFTKLAVCKRAHLLIWVVFPEIASCSNRREVMRLAD
jgi:hypothetical protein